MVLVWYHICDKRVFQGVHAICGLSILYTYDLHHSWGVLIVTVTSDTSSFWYIRNLMYRRRYITFLMYQMWQGWWLGLCMIQQAIHHGLDVSIHRDTSNLMYRQGSGPLLAVTGRFYGKTWFWTPFWRPTGSLACFLRSVSKFLLIFSSSTLACSAKLRKKDLRHTPSAALRPPRSITHW